MTPEGWVLVVGAAGTQAVLILQAWKAGRVVGNPNGSGSLVQKLDGIEKKMDAFCERLKTVENKVL